MPVPKTFSGPGESYVPSYEDSLRYAVWLMLTADNVNRLAYSSDPDDEHAEIRIYQGRADADPESGAITTPQQLVGVAIGQSTWRYDTGKGGRKAITIAVMHIEAADDSHLDTDVSAPLPTPETRLARVEQILMSGTRWKDDDEDHRFLVVDPYNSPLAEDGTYDPEQWKILTTKTPAVRATTKQTFPNRVVRSREELFGLHPVRDFVVTYGVLATYEIEVPDRERQHGGD